MKFAAEMMIYAAELTIFSGHILRNPVNFTNPAKFTIFFVPVPFAGILSGHNQPVA